uniref:Uncharacterized protein n=1 Tax=Cajanus cajan TaxID=3821 RepID=A0A151SZ55_CAJCA|nr:hypothetical protein KK1_015524 [Cajanus cajan]
MEADTSHIIPPPVFDGEEYDLWAARMTTHLEALDLWESIEEDYVVHPLPENPIMAQLKNHKERKIRKVKVKACLFSSISKFIFMRIMNLNSAKDIWNYLKSEY